MKVFLKVLLIILIIIIITRACIIKPQPPVVTPTVTQIATATSAPSPTSTSVATAVPTYTPTVVFTPVVTVTHDVTQTPMPTPVLYEVNTGYDNGALHFRSGPSTSFLPKWSEGQGAVYEGDMLEFVACADTEYPWLMVIFKNLLGFVYGGFVEGNPCN